MVLSGWSDEGQAGTHVRDFSIVFYEMIFAKTNSAFVAGSEFEIGIYS
jgi:hypothetical protein